MIYLEKIMVTL